MNFVTFRIEDVLGQMMGASLLGLFATAGSLYYLWLHRQPKLSTRKVRVERDYPDYRRHSR